jgi:hypothetical protein
LTPVTADIDAISLLAALFGPDADLQLMKLNLTSPRWRSTDGVSDTSN